MTTRSWTTETVHGRDCFDYWREAVCRTVLNVSVEHRAERFAAEIHGRQYGSLRFAAFSASGHRIVRSRADIARAADDHVLISLQRSGQSHITQDDTTFTLDPGEVAILDGDRPFRVAFPGRVSRILALIPRATLQARAPWLRHTRSLKLAGAAAFLDLARQHLLQLAETETLADAEAMLLTDNLCNLLALATMRERTPAASALAVPLDAILAYCRQSLTEPALSPAMVAAHFGISVRTLHLRFRATGLSFGEWVLTNRLELARKVLASGRPAHGGIADVAFGCGFRDLSHFNRSFRARFGLTPGDCRAGRG